MGVDGVGAPGGAIIPGCVGIGPSGLSFSVTVTVVLRRAGQSWLAAAATAAGGTIEMVINRGVGELEFGSVSVAGMVRGVATTTVPPFYGRPDTRVTFGSGAGDAVAIDGRVASQGFITDGTIAGPVTFSAPEGPVINCTPGTVRWSSSGPVLN